MGGDQEQIVAQVTKMRHPAILPCWIEDRCRDIDEWHAGPGEADGKHRIEIKTARCADRLHDVEGGLERIESETKEGVFRASAKRFECGEKIPRHASHDTLQGGIRSELGNPTNAGCRVGGRDFHKAADHAGGMLAIGIHKKHVCEALVAGSAQGGKKRSTFSRVAFHAKEASARWSCPFCAGVTAIRAAVHTDPDMLPVGQCSLERGSKLRAAVVAWKQDKGFHRLAKDDAVRSGRVEGQDGKW